MPSDSAPGQNDLFPRVARCRDNRRDAVASEEQVPVLAPVG